MFLFAVYFIYLFILGGGVGVGNVLGVRGGGGLLPWRISSFSKKKKKKSQLVSSSLSSTSAPQDPGNTEPAGAACVEVEQGLRVFRRLCSCAVQTLNKTEHMTFWFTFTIFTGTFSDKPFVLLHFLM